MSNIQIKLPSKEQIKKAQEDNPWSFGNQILYDLCKENFWHKEDDKIITKVLFIGRIYAAAVERRKTEKTEINDDFYVNTIVQTFQRSNIDQQLYELLNIKSISVENFNLLLETHSYLTKLLCDITALEKRSFSSKYLHFHLPNLFYIYDTRAKLGLKEFISNVPKNLRHHINNDFDKEYPDFYLKCFELTKQIEKECDIKLTPRELDNLLISIANEKEREKLKSKNKNIS